MAPEINKKLTENFIQYIIQVLPLGIAVLKQIQLLDEQNVSLLTGCLLHIAFTLPHCSIGGSGQGQEPICYQE
jgi:hypothetical protein